MANVLTTNPHKIDTAMTDTLMSTTPRRPASAPIELVSVYWLNPTTAGDTFQIVDANGDIIKEGRCEVDGQSQEFDMHGLAVDDYKVSTLSSGVVYIQRRTTGQEA